MIHYSLRCPSQHEFDGWFPNSGAFEKQVSAGLVICPTCGRSDVERAIMAPALGGRARPPDASAPLAPPAATTPQVVVEEARMPDQMRATLQKLRAEIERNCDYVGETFAEQARRMHRGETEKRGIYGEATPEQADKLLEEGVQVARIPWVPRADS